MKTTFDKKTDTSMPDTRALPVSWQTGGAASRDGTGLRGERARRVSVSIRGGRIVFLPITPDGKNQGQ